MRNDQWEDPGAMERLNWFLCFLLPVGGAKLLEEETESKVKRLVSVYIEALKNLLVSWQFLFQGSFSSLVLASFKFQELFTYITLFTSFFPL